MELQADTLFRADARGRLTGTREADGSSAPPPRFFFGRTRHGHLWRFAADLPGALVAELARLAALERIDWPLEELPERMETLRARLAEHAPIERVHHGPAFRFPEHDLAPAGAAVDLTPDRVDTLPEELAWLRGTLAAHAPCAAVLEDGRAVAACWTARRSERAAEAGVRTLPGFRGRGLATAAVAAWARALRRAGRLPLYSTEWSNAGSRGVAARLGLIPYGADLHLR